MDDVCEVTSRSVLLGCHLQSDGHLGVVCGQQVHDTASSAAGGRDALRWVLQPTYVSAYMHSQVNIDAGEDTYETIVVSV